MNKDKEIIFIPTEAKIEEDFIETNFSIKIPIMKLDILVISSEKYTANKSYYPAEELEKAYKSLILKPININHIQNNVVGVISDSYIKKRKDIVDVYAKGIIWEYNFEDEASEIRKSATQNQIPVSVEALPGTVECPECGEKFDYIDYKLKKACSHLNKTDKRILRDFEFLGLAVLLPPKVPAYADAKAELLAKMNKPDFRKMSTKELIKFLKEVRQHYERKSD